MAEFFTNQRIIEPIVNHYKNLEYVDFVLNSDFEEGWDLYIQCIKRINDLEEEKTKSLLWGLWLVDIQNGCKDDFDTFYKARVKINSNEELGNKKELENELIGKYKNMDIKRVKRRLLE